MMHKVKIEPITENGYRTKLSIDGKDVRCAGYVISQQVGELPVVELDIYAVPGVEHETIVHVSNKEEIARLMDEDEFKEFCDIWNEVHEYEK